MSKDLPKAGRLLAVDAGEKRVGLAISDQRQLLATPLKVMTRRSRVEDVERLQHLANRHGVVGLLVGHPVNADGTPGPEARRAARYGHRLAAALGLPVQLWDEFGSTQEARERLRKAGVDPRRQVIDAEAAAVFLQDYLDQDKSNQPPTLDPQ